MNPEASAVSAFKKPVTGLRVRRMRLIMALCLMEVVPNIVIILNYLGVSVLQLINFSQLFIFLGIASMIRGLLSSAKPYFAFAFVLLFLSLIKSFSISGVDYFNFEASAVFSYYYSIFMPTFVFLAIYSQINITAREVLQDLRWFSKWFMLIISPIVVIYAALHFSGRIVYFGFGVNFHYATPFLIHRGGMLLLIASLILISGKRASLVNFLVQVLLFQLGNLKRTPILILLVSMVAVGILVLAGENLKPLFSRFTLMLDALQSADRSNGILGLANSFEAMVIFGGRLEEVVGIIEYFKQHPAQIWFGSPPGSNFIWLVEISDHSEKKSFSHLTWLGYIFRYGIVPTGFLLTVFIYRLISDWDTRNPLWLLFVGVVSSATFGGNLYYSPVEWTMVALFFRFGPAISQEIRKESRYSS